MPSTCAAGVPGAANARYVMSWRRARWRIRCQVRSLPPLSSGSSRSDFSHRMRMRKRLNSFAIDEGAVPQLEVDEAPEAVAAVDRAGGVRAQKLVDGARLEDAALARAAIEQDVARHAV